MTAMQCSYNLILSPDLTVLLLIAMTLGCSGDLTPSRLARPVTTYACEWMC